MDNFCNVLDDAQGRCSCSANLKNYAKTEAALKQATEELQDVAQKIQYIGLTADEIETLLSQTAAEAQMQKTSDNTQLKNDLDKIKNMIVDVKSGSATTTDSGISLDLSGLLDFTISSTGFDLESLFGNSKNTSSISNQRGEQLYKTAAARCKASILNGCAAQGVDTKIITNAYDLEIDKQCIQYERSLTDANTQMESTVRNATSVLQKARLLVSQQKNQYDLRGCVNALDACMQDDFVCGGDYETCLDPTGKYIVGGNLVMGGMPGEPGGKYSGGIASGMYSVWNYAKQNGKYTANAFKSGTINAMIDDGMFTAESQFSIAGNRMNMVGFLQQKIGYIDDKGRAQGLCAGVFNRCQKLTHSGTGSKSKYNIDNSVIREYLRNILPRIKKSQDDKLSNHANECISDVVSCLNQNNYTSSNNIAMNACRAQILTCMSVNGVDTSGADGLFTQMDVLTWLQSIFGGTSNPDNTGGNTGGDNTGGNTGGDNPDNPDNPDVPDEPSQAQDEKDCLAIGGHVSKTGTICIVSGNHDTQATNFGWAPYRYFASNSVEVNQGSAFVGKKVPANTYLYVMRYSYLKEKKKCEDLGGTLDIAVGKTHNNANIFCSMTFAPGKMTQEQCEALQNVWPQGAENYVSGGFSASKETVNGVVTKQGCSYMPQGFYYVGGDLPGTCLPGMVEKSDGTGNCTCQPGYCYDTGYSCKDCSTPDEPSEKEKLLAEILAEYNSSDATEDRMNCISMGGEESVTGSLCIITGNGKSVAALDAQAKNFGFAHMVSFADGVDDRKSRESHIGKTIPENAHIYVMRHDYLGALYNCVKRGGNLDIAVGQRHKGSFVNCIINWDDDMPVTYEQCQSWFNSWPGYSITNLQNVYSNTSSKGKYCKYLPQYLYYTGGDFNTECFPNMVERSDGTGNCECASGYKPASDWRSCVAN